MTNHNGAAEVSADKSHEANLENEISYLPHVNIYEENDNFVLIANMPGVSREKVKLKVEEGILTIAGKINFDKDDKKYILNEAPVGNYFRKFKISNSIDESKIDAKYQDGQLIVSLPKHDRLKPRIISVN